MSGDRRAEIVLFWKPKPPLNRNRKIFWMQSLARKVKGFQCTPALVMQIRVITRRVKKFFHQVETCVSDFVHFKRTFFSTQPRDRFKHSDRIFPVKFNRRSCEIFHRIPKGWRSADESGGNFSAFRFNAKISSVPIVLAFQAHNNWNCKTAEKLFSPRKSLARVELRSKVQEKKKNWKLQKKL